MGQNKLFLDHKSKSSKKKYLNLDREFYIKTKDTTYSYKKIIGFTDSTILIPTWTKTGKDTIYTYTYKISKSKDTNYTQVRPRYKQDTIVILFSKIQSIKKDWFKNRHWLEPFGYLAIGGVIGVVFLPIAAIDKGAEGVKEWAIFEGIIVAICAPPIFIGTRKTKYDLNKKWTLKAEK
ncbi:MAG: hypothetical protein V4667_12185 [Bacteroidota bacterium]